MVRKKWQTLAKIRDSFIIEPETQKYTGFGCTTPRNQFAHVTFDDTGERCLAADTRGVITYIQLGKSMRRCTLGKVRSCTFLAFNTLNKNELLIGSKDGIIEILRLDQDTTKLCSLIGHTLAVKRASFFSNYALTASPKEVIIWNLSSYCKMHQLRFSTTDITIRKASISHLGLIVALYQDSTMQIWEFENLEQDIKIDVKTFGLRDVRDFDFTKDGRALILGGLQNKIITFNTFTWNLMRSIELPDNFIGTRQLAILPQALDGGANKILLILASDGQLYFLDLAKSQFMPSSLNEPLIGILKIAVSSCGRYVARIEVDGNLKLNAADALLSIESKTPEKVQARTRPRAHSAVNHLSCVRQYIKEELNLKRLLPILHEFGEYPEKYRPLIWATILELPRNRNAYSILANKTPYRDLSQKILSNYPIADKSKSLFFTTIMNCLVHWCPFLLKSVFLPCLIFPFLVVFQGNHLTAFEVIIFVLYNYCQRWFEYHPLPPLNILAMSENILSEADPALLQFFCENGVTTSEYIWPLLQSMLSEVLTGSDWLILWDHLFSSGRPALLLMCAVAYSICSRETIMSHPRSSEDLKQFFHKQGNIRITDLLKVARKLDQSTPFHLHPGRYFRNKICLLPKTGPYPDFLDDEYPTFLVQDAHSQLEQLQRHKEWKLQQQFQLRNMKRVEEERLRKERENFLKEIHAARMNEVRGLYESIVLGDEMDQKFAYEDRNFWSEDELGVQNKTLNKTCRNKDCQTLQNQVQQLELEVQTLLQTLDTSRTTKSSSNIFS